MNHYILRIELCINDPHRARVIARSVNADDGEAGNVRIELEREHVKGYLPGDTMTILTGAIVFKANGS